MKRLIVIFLALGYLQNSFAQEMMQDVLIPVEVITNCGDTIGDSLSASIMNKINYSDVMKLSDEGEIRIIMKITSMDRLPERPNLSTIYSIIWLLKSPDYIFDTYLTSELGITSKKIIENSANNIVNKTTNLVNDMMSTLKQ